MMRGLKFCGSYIRERRKTNPIDNISFCGWQMVVKTASEAVKQGIWCLSHQMPCLSKILILCGFVPYFSASDTATAQATVAPTMGLLSLWNQVYPVISIFSYSVLSWLVLRRKIAFTLASHIDILLIFPMFFKVIFIRGWQNVSTLIYITSFSRPDTAAGYVSGSSDPFLHIPLKMFR